MTTVIETGQMRHLNRRVLRATATVAAATVLVKVCSVIKEFVIAAKFGRSDELEAFLLAALVPGLLINLIAESMNQALIPALVRVRDRDGRERAKQLLSNCMTGSVLMLVSVSLVMCLSARWLLPLLGSGFAISKSDLVVRLFYGLLPIILLGGSASILAAVLNASGDFAVPAIAPIVNSLVLITGVLLIAKSGGVWILVYGTVLGALVHAAWMARTIRGRGYGFRLRWYGMNEATRKVSRQFGQLLLSGAVASAGLLVDQGMAAMLPAGSLSALVYAGRFVSVPMALLGGAISVALTPAFSEIIAREEWNECRLLMRKWAWRSMVVAGAAAIALIVGARALIRMTLQHGVFGPLDTSAVSAVLVMYAVQIPFFVSSRVFYRFLVAAQRTDLVFYCGILNLVLDVVFNFVLMRWMGVAGIALATSLWTVSTFIFLWYWSGRVLRKASGLFPSAQAAD